jgi:hypothetical protein
MIKKEMIAQILVLLKSIFYDRKLSIKDLVKILTIIVN